MYCTHLFIIYTQLFILISVTANEFKRWLAKQGCTFEEGRGKGGHILVRRGNRFAALPIHGNEKELGTGLVSKIKKQLGLK